MRAVLVVFLFIFAVSAVFANDTERNPWEISYLSARIQPLLEILPNGTDLTAVSFAPSIETSVDYRLPFLPMLFVRLDLGYTAISRKTTLLNMIDVGPGVGAFFNVGRIGLSASFSGGLGIGIISDTGSSSTLNTLNPFIGAGVHASYLFPGNFSIGIGARYKSYASFLLFQNLGVSLGFTYHFPKISQTGQVSRDTAEVDADCRKQAWGRRFTEDDIANPRLCAKHKTWGQTSAKGLKSARAAIDPPVCSKCGAEMKVIAVIQESDEIRRILSHLVKIGRSPLGSAAFIKLEIGRLSHSKLGATHLLFLGEDSAHRTLGHGHDSHNRILAQIRRYHACCRYHQIKVTEK